MFKKASALLLISVFSLSSVSYADTFEDNSFNEDQNNTYNEPSEDFNGTDQNQDNSYNENQYNNDEFNNYNDGFNEYNDNGYNDGYSDDSYNNDYYDGNEYSDEYTEEPAFEEEVVEPEPEIIPEPEPEITEPVEVYEEPEEPEEPVEIQINQLETESVKVTGRVVDEENNPVVGVKLSLTGETALEAVTDDAGEFIFEEVDSGDYELTVLEAEGYAVDEAAESFSVGNRNKSGVILTLSEEETEIALPPSEVDAGEEVSGETAGHLSPMDWTLIGIGIIFSITGLTVFILKRIRS
ncbi:carboxypeptidase-like regulatory domain-containing protein [Corticicoccus populi]|uniref:Carboxypeptidase-like regulatory domain-containing protein n=1 Tax=Corticicoccus populi TaxID=1812821 RepID=A0ABW5WZ22_9STAP